MSTLSKAGRGQQFPAFFVSYYHMHHQPLPLRQRHSLVRPKHRQRARPSVGFRAAPVEDGYAGDSGADGSSGKWVNGEIVTVITPRQRGNFGDPGGGDRGYAGPGPSGGESGGQASQSTEEQRRRHCSDAEKARSNDDTASAAALADISEWVSTGADTVAGIAVFIPGGQGVALGAKMVSLGAQGVQAGANIYIGAKTGNYTALKQQGAQALTGAVTGRAVGAFTGFVKGGGKSLSKGAASRTGAFGDAVGAVFGDGASDFICR